MKTFNRDGKTFNRDGLARQVAKMKIGDSLAVNCEAARQHALNVARILKKTGTIQWSLVSRKNKGEDNWVITAVPTTL